MLHELHGVTSQKTAILIFTLRALNSHLLQPKIPWSPLKEYQEHFLAIISIHS